MQRVFTKARSLSVSARFILYETKIKITKKTN